MDKIFTIVKDSKIYNSDLENINEFLKENPQYFVKSITPISQHGDGHCRYYGMAIVVSERQLEIPLNILHNNIPQLQNLFGSECINY